MKNLFLMLALLICSQSFGAISEVQTPKDIPYKNHLGTQSSKFLIEKENKKVDFIQIVKHNLNSEQKKKLDQFLPLLNETLGSQCFSDFMENRALIQTNGKSRSQVVEHIRSSKVGIELVSYWSLKGTVGYTYPNVNKVWMNKRLHDGFTLCKSASNLAHEGSHKIGYGHDYNRTSRRPYSVPYSINAAFNACCGKIDTPQVEIKPKKIRVCYRSWKTLWLKKTCYWKEVK